MVNLVTELLQHLGLLIHFLPKVLPLVLNALCDHFDLVQVLVLIGQVLPLDLDQLLVVPSLVILDFFVGHLRLVIDAGKARNFLAWHLLGHGLLARSLRPLNQGVNVQGLVLDHFDNGAGRVVYVNVFLASLDQRLLG